MFVGFDKKNMHKLMENSMSAMKFMVMKLNIFSKKPEKQ